MITQPTQYLPVQQAAVQQQLQQAPTEFSAIKINILGANVAAPAQQPVPVQQPKQPEIEQTVVQPQLPEGTQLNYIA